MARPSFPDPAPTLPPTSDALCEQLEAAWSSGTPSLEEFVSRAGGQIAVLLDLVCVDMEQRFGRGERPRLEQYLTRVPALAGASGAVVALIEWEYLLRQRFNDTVEAGELEQRFPGQRQQLAGLLSRLRAGRYRLAGELGGGGMGLVFRAVDSECDRILAVKVLRPEYQGEPAAVARFTFEARLTARLQHPSIPPVHEVGRLDDGRPFFAMKLIEGRTLAQLLAERKSAAEELPRWLALFGQVTRTMAYAHSEGIIHRDLKPGNIMVGAFGEVQVMDWGLAKVLGERRDVSI
jgi:hypothetical protein